ncbi:winged helix-turn-helix domain-containing protein [Phocaeicola abscessus]
MLTEKAGTLAGMIWNALNETEGLTLKQLKKATGLRSEKDLYLGLGWLLREGKVETSEAGADIFVKLV